MVVSGISHLKFYGNVVYKAFKLQNHPNDLYNCLSKLLFKGYTFSILIKSLNMVLFGENSVHLVRSLTQINC
jgi:hypothetical protein